MIKHVPEEDADVLVPTSLHHFCKCHKLEDCQNRWTKVAAEQSDDDEEEEEEDFVFKKHKSVGLILYI